ncbi:MAG: hypothetical protein IT450_13625 [Phycisphaerales bacterium]|nr:hypothetical protein [Phycisphaerales bacterium]
MLHLISRLTVAASFATGIGLLVADAAGVLPGGIRSLVHFLLIALANLALPVFFLRQERSWGEKRNAEWKHAYGFTTPVCVEAFHAKADRLGVTVLTAFVGYIPITHFWPAMGIESTPGPHHVVFLIWGGLAGLAYYYRRRAKHVAAEIKALLDRRHRPCMTCGYDLTPGNLERCPECGAPRENPR